MVFVLLFTDPLLRFLGANSDVFSYAKEYLYPIILGISFFMLSNTIALLLRAEGSVMAGFTGNMIGTMTNLILDPIFILGFRWGVA